MARINFDDYLITFEIRYFGNLRRSMDRAIARFRKIPSEVQKQFLDIRIPTLESGALPIRFKASIKIPEVQWRQLADETERLRDSLFSSTHGSSELYTRTAMALDEVYTNIATRFVNASLDVITEQLVNAVESQTPVVEEFNTIGIKAAIGNIKSLNASTVPYSINRKTGEVSFRGATARTYQYPTADGGSVPADGYWAFQEFGTSNGVPARHFYLGFSREIHSADQSAIDSVHAWLRSRVNEYTARAKEIMK